MDPWANQMLLPRRWFCVETDHDVYYVKHFFESTNYCLLVTNLRQVWSDTAHAPDILAMASRQHLDIDSHDQIEQLLSQLWVFMADLEQCEFRHGGGNDRSNDHGADDGQDTAAASMQIVCKESKGFASFTWTFECKLLKDDGSTVLYDHFISPLLGLISNKDGGIRKRLDDAWLTGLAAASKAIADETNAEKDTNKEGAPEDMRTERQTAVSPTGTATSSPSVPEVVGKRKEDKEDDDDEDPQQEKSRRQKQQLDEEVEEGRRRHPQKRKKLFR